jgi:hypothetical protein
MPTDEPHRDFRLTERKEPFWFRWLVLVGISLGVAAIVAGWFRLAFR